jgi:hypothetical protein
VPNRSEVLSHWEAGQRHLEIAWRTVPSPMAVESRDRPGCCRKRGPTRRMLTPSQNLQGFVVDDDSSSILFGKGFGPKPYQELFDFWTKDFSNLSTFTPEELSLGELLEMRMRSCNHQKSYEGCLSGVVSAIIQKLMTRFVIGNNELENLEVVHQTYVPQKTSASADITIMDCCSSKDKVVIHSIMELKWDYDLSQFPESQACAYASWFSSAGSLIHSWVPTFVLTKSHYQIGVAFKSFGNHWGFSEIETYSTGVPFGANDVIPLLRFAKFFCCAAQRHRSFPTALRGAALSFVNNTGQTKFEYNRWVGARVLGDTFSNKVIKFYPSLQAAQSALQKQKEIRTVLGYTENSELIEGCGGGMCAIIDDLIEEEQVTYNHLIDLTTQVALLHEKRFVHGDLRLQNIMFLKDGTVKLIDFDWSGAVGVAMFPDNVNISAFDSRALSFSITGGQRIPKNFDWHCLADIFEKAGLPLAVQAAVACNKDAVIRQLTAASNSSQGIDPLQSIYKLCEPASPNLGFMGERLFNFYDKKLTRNDVVSSSRKRPRTDASI